MNVFLKTLAGPELDKAVRKALSSFVDRNVEFTAYDITQQIRKDVGDNIEVVHPDVRQRVHDLMQHDNRYATYLKNYGSYLKNYGSNKATAYKPITNTPIVPIGRGQLSVTTTPSPKDKSALYMYPKSEGRVTVPASVLKKIGVSPFHTVFVVEDSNVLTVTKHRTGKYTGDAFSLDKHGSFRLRKTYTSGYKRFKVVTKSDRVELIGEK